MDAELTDSGLDVPMFDCEFCSPYDKYTGPFAGQRAWAGHCRSKAHKARVALAEAEAQPDGPEGAKEPSESEAVTSEADPAPDAPEGISSMDMYKEVQGLIEQGRLEQDAIMDTLNAERYADIFASFKRSDSDKIKPYDLNDEARLVLLKLLRGIASS
jgi:hypothetical protein